LGEEIERRGIERKAALFGQLFFVLTSDLVLPPPELPQIGGGD